MSRREYYELLNSKTFFWVRRERLISFLGARAYRGKVHDVLTVETEGVVDEHHDEITLSPINSGAFFGSGRRGVGTFRSIPEYPYQDMVKKKHADAIVELAVDCAVRISQNSRFWWRNGPGIRPCVSSGTRIDDYADLTLLLVVTVIFYWGLF